MIKIAILFALTSYDQAQAGGTLTGANSCGSHGLVAGLIAEIVLTCIFVLVVLGLAGMGAAVFADTGVALIVILNGMRLMHPLHMQH